MLSRLSLRGFKSFADQTSLELGPGVNVVVHDHGLHRRRAEFFAPFWAALGAVVACRSAHFLGLTWGNVVGDTGLEPMTSAV